MAGNSRATGSGIHRSTIWSRGFIGFPSARSTSLWGDRIDRDAKPIRYSAARSDPRVRFRAAKSSQTPDPNAPVAQ